MEGGHRARGSLKMWNVGRGFGFLGDGSGGPRACHNQPKEPPESRPACGAEAEGEITREGARPMLHLLLDWEYPHWMMMAGAILVAAGFIGLAFHRNRNLEDRS